jgi:HSP20 family protein
MFWRDSGRRSLWREMDRLQREMNRMMGTFAPRGTGNFPPLNMWANEEHVVLTAELPGVDLDSLDISVVGDTITLAGRRELDAGGDEARYHRHERWHGNFTRTMQLPFRIDAEKVDANYRQGRVAGDAAARRRRPAAPHPDRRRGSSTSACRRASWPNRSTTQRSETLTREEVRHHGRNGTH